jgi:hypothetical protein
MPRAVAARAQHTVPRMDLWNVLKRRRNTARPEAATARHWLDSARQRPDLKRLLLLIGLGGLSWVATYVGMLELIQANLGDLPLTHKVIIGFSCAMLMTMIIWLLDKMFAPANFSTRLCYIAGYLFLSIISVGFGFGFYWKVLESRGVASRSAENAVTQVQSELFGASTRLEQLQSTLDQLTTVSAEKAEIERTRGRTCPGSGPGDGPRRKMRDDDAQRFKFASDFVKGRIATVKTDMAALDTELQKIVADDRSIIDPRTGNRNEFLRGLGRKLDLTVAGFNAFRTDPQLKQIRADLGARAENTTFPDGRGGTLSCPDPQLQAALRGVARAIEELPELEKPRIAAVEGSEATIEAFRRLTTTFFGLLTFNPAPSADALQNQQTPSSKALGAAQVGDFAHSRLEEPAAGLSKRDYVPLGVAIFVDICLLLVSIGRPINSFLHLEEDMRLAERGPVLPILARFHNTHSDDDAVKYFEVFRDVIFDANGQYYVAVPLSIPECAEQREDLEREAHRLANLCYALEGKGILRRPRRTMATSFIVRQLKQRNSKFVRCYGRRRPPRYQRGWQTLKSVWAEMPEVETPAFKVYRFRKGAWPEMILQAVMRAARDSEAGKGEPNYEPIRLKSDGLDSGSPLRLPMQSDSALADVDEDAERETTNGGRSH